MSQPVTCRSYGNDPDSRSRTLVPGTWNAATSCDPCDWPRSAFCWWKCSAAPFSIFAPFPASPCSLAIEDLPSNERTTGTNNLCRLKARVNQNYWAKANFISCFLETPANCCKPYHVKAFFHYLYNNLLKA